MKRPTLEQFEPDDVGFKHKFSSLPLLLEKHEYTVLATTASWCYQYCVQAEKYSAAAESIYFALKANIGLLGESSKKTRADQLCAIKCDIYEHVANLVVIPSGHLSSETWQCAVVAVRDLLKPEFLRSVSDDKFQPFYFGIKEFHFKIMAASHNTTLDNLTKTLIISWRNLTNEACIRAVHRRLPSKDQEFVSSCLSDAVESIGNSRNLFSSRDLIKFLGFISVQICTSAFKNCNQYSRSSLLLLENLIDFCGKFTIRDAKLLCNLHYTISNICRKYYESGNSAEFVQKSDILSLMNTHAESACKYSSETLFVEMFYYAKNCLAQTYFDDNQHEPCAKICIEIIFGTKTRKISCIGYDNLLRLYITIELNKAEKMGHYDDWEKINKLFSECQDKVRSVGLLYRASCILEKLEKYDYAAKFKESEIALRKDNVNSNDHADLANYYLKLRRYKDARQMFRRAIKVCSNRDHLRTYQHMIGACYMEEGDLSVNQESKLTLYNNAYFAFKETNDTRKMSDALYKVIVTKLALRIPYNEISTDLTNCIQLKIDSIISEFSIDPIDSEKENQNKLQAFQSLSKSGKYDSACRAGMDLLKSLREMSSQLHNSECSRNRVNLN